MLNKISSMLDAVANSLETKGLIKEAYEIDKVADTIDASIPYVTKPFKVKKTDKIMRLLGPYFESQNLNEKTQDIIGVDLVINDPDSRIAGFYFRIYGKNLGKHLGDPRDYFQTYDYSGNISPQGKIINDVGNPRPKSLRDYIHNEVDLKELYKEFFDQIKDYKGPHGGTNEFTPLPPGTPPQPVKNLSKKTEKSASYQPAFERAVEQFKRAIPPLVKNPPTPQFLQKIDTFLDKLEKCYYAIGFGSYDGSASQEVFSRKDNIERTITDAIEKLVLVDEWDNTWLDEEDGIFRDIKELGLGRGEDARENEDKAFDDSPYNR